MHPQGHLPPVHGVKPAGQIFKPAEAASGLGEVVEMRLGRIQILLTQRFDTQVGKNTFKVRGG